MKRTFLIPIFLIAQFILVNPGAAGAAVVASWKNFYGMTWRGTSQENATYAKQMGYDYIGVGGKLDAKNYKNLGSLANGLNFYTDSPPNVSIPQFGYSIEINTTVSYAGDQKNFYLSNMCLKDTNNIFPYNTVAGDSGSFASGWWREGGNRFSIRWNLQKNSTIDAVIDAYISVIQASEGVNFKYAGYIVDVLRLTGDFNSYRNTGSYNTAITLNNNTCAGGPYDYATYSDGSAEFWKRLKQKVKGLYSNSKWIVEPTQLYSTSTLNEYIYHISLRDDTAELKPDLIVAEFGTTDFANPNHPLFQADMNVTADMLGLTQNNVVGEVENRLYAASAGSSGSWFDWYGRFGGSGNMPDFQSITAVYPRLKLIRVIPNWDNLNGIAINATSRVWNNSTTDPVYNSYDSNGYQQSHIDGNVMYSRQPNTGKLFAVFLTTNGVITLKAGEAVTSMQNTDGYFIEAGDAASDLTVTDTPNGKEIALNSTVTIPIDSTNGQVKGAGYILTVTYSSPPVITSALSAAGMIGTALSYQITADNSPTSFSAAGLPAGLSVSSGTGLISGTPATIGISSVTISAANASGTGSASLALSVYSACDLNRDWASNVADVQLQVNQALGVAACASDLNRDGLCNVVDVQRVVNVGLGEQCVLGP